MKLIRKKELRAMHDEIEFWKEKYNQNDIGWQKYSADLLDQIDTLRANNIHKYILDLENEPELTHRQIEQRLSRGMYILIKEMEAYVGVEIAEADIDYTTVRINTENGDTVNLTPKFKANIDFFKEHYKIKSII